MSPISFRQWMPRRSRSTLRFQADPVYRPTNQVEGKSVAPVPVTDALCCVRDMSRFSPPLPTCRSPVSSPTPYTSCRAASRCVQRCGRRKRASAAGEGGFPILPLVDMRRPVATAGGEEWARFTVARIAPGTMPEGRVQFLTHQTEELVWREPFLDHPNGARRPYRCLVAAADPDEPASASRGSPAVRSTAGEVSIIPLERGSVWVGTPEFLERKFGIAPDHPFLFLAAHEIEVTSLARLRGHLGSAGLSSTPLSDGLVVSLPPALGGTIIFRAPEG